MLENCRSCLNHKITHHCCARDLHVHNDRLADRPTTNQPYTDSHPSQLHWGRYDFEIWILSLLITAFFLTITHQNYMPKSPVTFDRKSQSLFTALRATDSYTGSPVNRDRTPNSSTIVPAPAVQVSLMQSFGTPSTRLT